MFSRHTQERKKERKLADSRILAKKKTEITIQNNVYYFIIIYLFIIFIFLFIYFELEDLYLPLYNLIIKNDVSRNLPLKCWS